MFRKVICVAPGESVTSSAFVQSVYTAFPSRSSTDETVGISLIPLYIEKITICDNGSRCNKRHCRVFHGREGESYGVSGLGNIDTTLLFSHQFYEP